MKRAFRLLALAACLLTAACAREAHNDTAQNLDDSQGTASLPPLATSAEYFLPPETAGHVYQLRIPGVTGSYVDIEFGPILDATLLGTEAWSAFGDVKRVESPEKARGLLVTFDLNAYAIRRFEANVDMTVTASAGGRKFLSRQYAATGVSPGMFWGPDGVKKKVDQSTRCALDQIVMQFASDLKSLYRSKQSLPSNRGRVVIFPDNAGDPCRKPSARALPKAGGTAKQSDR